MEGGQMMRQRRVGVADGGDMSGATQVIRGRRLRHIWVMHVMVVVSGHHCEDEDKRFDTP